MLHIFNSYFLKRTFHRLLITGLTLHWKYHAHDESKLLYRVCLASFKNRKFCIKLSKFCRKLSKIQLRKNTDISVLSVFFSGIGFRVFSNTATAYLKRKFISHLCSKYLSAILFVLGKSYSLKIIVLLSTNQHAVILSC
jgi:hypothetical protein